MLDNLVSFIENKNGIGNKDELCKLAQEEFGLVCDRKVYFCENFAVRFCRSNSIVFGNTVLSLSALLKYDTRPFVVCVVTPTNNHLLLANATFIKKISHSSKQLRIDNIKGSFNGSDILRCFGGISNEPCNFEKLYSFHQNYTFQDNLERLVSATNEICPTGKKFVIESMNTIIIDAPNRAIDFSESTDYIDLSNDLNDRTKKFENEIVIASLIDNVNLRGRIIEYLIAGEDDEVRAKIIGFLEKKEQIPRIVTHDGLGDYCKSYNNFNTQTDIKTKIMLLGSAPKGYNVDKVLEFLSTEKSVFMIFLIGIKENRIETKLISMFQNTLISNTVIQEHWAGRNSRGVTQFMGEAIKRIIENEDNEIDLNRARVFLDKLMNL